MDYIKIHFPNAMEWAKEIKQEALQIVKDLNAPTRVCKSARSGIIPLNINSRELSGEINRYILSFLPSRKVIPRNRIYRLLEDVPFLHQQLKIMLQENKIIDETTTDKNGDVIKIDHHKPSIERQLFIKFVKEQTDLKIYGSELSAEYSTKVAR